MSEIVNYLASNIPGYFGASFKPQDAVDFLDTAFQSGVANSAALEESLNAVIGTIAGSNPQGLPNPDYVRKRSLIIDAVEKLAKDRMGGEEATQRVVDEEVEEKDLSSKGLVPADDYQYQYSKKYADIQAYRIGRFRGSSATENMLVSRFVNDTLIKQALIDTDARKLVSDKDIPGMYDSESSEIDYNLKQYRKNLLKDLVERVTPAISNEDGVKKLEYSDQLLYSDRFEEAIKAIESRVDNVVHANQSIRLSDEGRLVELGEELKRTSDPKLQKILDDYVDYVILTDFNKLFKYYAEDTISVSDYNDDFDAYTRKYKLGKIRAMDEANVNWTDKIRSGIDLSSDLYKTIIENTPMLNFITGLPIGGSYLYPALAGLAVSRYYAEIDPKQGAAGVKEVLLRAMRDANNTFTQRNAVYTLYKRFFEERGDQLRLSVNNVNHPKNLKKAGKTATVSSFLDTIGRDNDQSVMNVILKPLQEVVKVAYAEVTEVGGERAMTEAGTRSYTIMETNVRNDVVRAINHLDSDKIESLVAKYGIQFNASSIDYKPTAGNLTYTITPEGAKEYPLDTIIQLSNDLLGIDFTNNSAHKEFREELTARALDGQPLPGQYLQFVYDALKVLQAKRMLYDPAVQEAIKDSETGGANTKTNSNVLNDALQSTTFNYNKPEENEIPLKTVAANAMYTLLAEAENRYAGNRVRNNTITADGKSVAGFSIHTLGLGLPQTHNWIRNSRSSVTHNELANDPLAKNPYILDQRLLEPVRIKSAVRIGTDVRGNSAMNDNETLTFDINLGYFNNIKRAVNKSKSIIASFDPVTYSDKSTNYMIPLNNAYLRQNLFVDNNGIAVPEDVTRQLHFDSVGHFYRSYANNILSDWRKIYVAISPAAQGVYDEIVSKAKTHSAKLTALNDLNQVFWKTNQYQTEGFEHGLKGLHAARFYADRAGVPLNNWVHYQNNGKSMDNDKITLNTKQALIDYVKLFDTSDRGAYNAYMDKLLIQSVRNLQGLNYVFTPETQSAITQMYPETDKKFTKGGGVSLTSQGNIPVSSVNDIHPAYRKYFNDFNFASENFVLASVGSPYAHKGSTVYDLLIAQTKRNVALTASMRKYTPGLDNGVEYSTRTAFMDDLTSYLKTIVDDNLQVVDNDGASLESMTQRIKTWNSLNGKYEGDGGPDHKSLFSHYDPNTGHFTLIKHAAFVMDNEMIRRSIGSDVDLLELHKKLYATDISRTDITRSLKTDVNLSHFQDTPLFYWDRSYDFDKNRSGYLYKLESIEYTGKNEKGESTYTIKKRNLTEAPDDLIVERNQNIKTMFDLWRTLGSIDSVEQTIEKTGLSYKNGTDIVYFKPSIAASHKLLDYESYIGTPGERMLPAEYIVEQRKEDKPAWEAYKKIFDSEGVVDAHIKLINKYSEMDHNDFNTQQLLDNEIGDYDIKVSGPEFLNTIQANKSQFKRFFNGMLDKGALNKGQLVFNTDNHVKYQRFKGKNIDRISFGGAAKVGQFNMNDTSTISKRKLAETEAKNPGYKDQVIPGIHALLTHPVSNLNGGVQLNAWHEAEDATVTAPTQMLNALIFNAKSIGNVDEVYKALANIVDKELTMALKDPDTQSEYDVNIPQLVRGLSNSEFYAKNKAELLRVFEKLLKETTNPDTFTLENLIKETFNSTNIPIDDTHIFNSAVADLANYFTKRGIRINFDGIFSVLAPSSGMLQFHDVKGGYLPVREANGLLSYRPLDPSKPSTLSRVDFDNWNNYNSWLLNKGEHTNQHQVIDLQPRDLKGQQVQLQLADGSVMDLSVLRTGQTHLIPEAEALASVTNIIKQYKQIINSDKSSDYGGSTLAEKKELLDASLDSFQQDMNVLIQKNPAVRHAVRGIMNDLVSFSPEADSEGLVDALYNRFAGNRQYRVIKNARLAEAKHTTNLALSHEYDYLDKLNLIGKAFTARLQDFLDVASTGQVPESLKDKVLFKHAKKTTNAKVTISRAECIAPIVAGKSFLLRAGDNMGDVDKEFFRKRLAEKLDFYDVKADAALVSDGGRKVYLHNGFAPKDIKPVVLREQDGRSWFTDRNNEPIFEVPRNTTLTEEGGQLHVYLRGNENLVTVLHSALNRAYRDDDDKFKIYPMGTTPKERNETKANELAKLESKAQIMWVSWQKYVGEVIGTRIPGQHYQSFQGMKIVGFTEGNKIHISHEVTLLSGSDFDIDKQNVIYHSVSGDGAITLWHPAGRYDSLEHLEKSMKLPLQQNRTQSDFASQRDTFGNNLSPIMDWVTPETDLKDLDTLLRVYEALKVGFRLDNKEHEGAIARLVDYDNFKKIIPNDEDPYAVVMSSPNGGLKGIKNFIVSRTNAIINDPSNFIYLSRPVSMDTPKLFADNSPKGEAARLADPHDPTSIARGKTDNMVGKKVIGIMATGLKVFSSVSLTYNNELRALAPIVNEVRRLELKKTELNASPIENADALRVLDGQLDKYNTHINKVVDNLRLDKTPLSLAKLARGEGALDLPPNINYGRISSEVMAEFVKRTEPASHELATIKAALAVSPAAVGMLGDYLKFRTGMQEDAADLLSQLLSAATDNAKELILAKINASPDLAGMYATMLMLDTPFEQIVDIMTSPLTEMLIRRGIPNIFDRSTAKNSISDLITTADMALGDDPGKADRAREALSLKYGLSIVGREVFDKDNGNRYQAADIVTMKNVADAAKEISLLGRILSINQGVKSNSWDLYKFKTSIEDYVSRTISTKFDLKTFLDSLASNKEYAEDMIERLNAGRHTFNVLYVLASTPHFAEQLKAYNAARSILELSSYKIATAERIKDKLRAINFLGEHQNINENQHKDIERFVENTILENFIQSETNRPELKAASPIFYKGDTKMTLTTAAGQLEFANWVRDEFLPRVKDANDYKGNGFIQGLTVDKRRDNLLNTDFGFVKLKMDTTGTKSLTQQGNEDSYVYGLKLLYDGGATDRQHPEDPSKDNNIVNTLFWYNLILNKNNITKNSYAKILGRVMGLAEGEQNSYRKLLELKGNIGKNERYDTVNEGLGIMVSNGVTFDLFELLKNYDTFSTDLRYVGKPREAGEDWQEDIPDDIDDIEESANEQDASSEEDHGADSIDMTDDLDNLDDDSESGGSKRSPKIRVNKVRTFDTPGTQVEIMLGKDIVFKDTIHVPISLIPHSSENRVKETYFSDYNPLAVARDVLGDQDVVNYQKMLHMNMHDLLTNLQAKFEIEIEQRSDGKVETSRFDSAKSYDCI